MRNYIDENLSDYGGLGNHTEVRKHIDEENQRKVMKAQFDLIKMQKQEIFEASRYREENRKTSKQAKKYAIVGIIIASATLLATVIGWLISFYVARG